MSIAGTRELGKADSLVEMAEGIAGFVERAAADGVSLREFEREIFDRLLNMGRTATDQFLALQGDGDCGETVVDDEIRTLHRSEEPAQRPLRTIFGEHRFQAYVYRRGQHPNTPIALRPVEERLGIEPDRFSPLLQEFTMLLGIEQAFDTAAESFATIFRQRLSVDTLEKVSRRMGARAGELMSKNCPTRFEGTRFSSRSCGRTMRSERCNQSTKSAGCAASTVSCFIRMRPRRPERFL